MRLHRFVSSRQSYPDYLVYLLEKRRNDQLVIDGFFNLSVSFNSRLCSSGGLDFGLVLQAMTISRCSNVLIKNLQFVNSQRMHLVVVDSSDIQLNGLQIQAPEQSPNTDGIHLQRVKNAQINNCVIQTG